MKNLFNSRLLLTLLMVLAMALFTAAVVTAQSDDPKGGDDGEEAEEGSPSQLSIQFEPDLGLNLFALANGPDYFEDDATAGGEFYVDLEGDCLPGYASSLATFGMVWVDETEPIAIEFTLEDEGDANVGLFMWELVPGQWWCTTEWDDESNSLNFDSLDRGAYFIWVVTEEPGTFDGTLTVYDD